MESPALTYLNKILEELYSMNMPFDQFYKILAIVNRRFNSGIIIVPVDVKEFDAKAKEVADKLAEEFEVGKAAPAKSISTTTYMVLGGIALVSLVGVGYGGYWYGGKNAITEKQTVE